MAACQGPESILASNAQDRLQIMRPRQEPADEAQLLVADFHNVNVAELRNDQISKGISVDSLVDSPLNKHGQNRLNAELHGT